MLCYWYGMVLARHRRAAIVIVTTIANGTLLQVLAIMEQCAAAEGDDSGKPTHSVRIADCGVCGLYEPAPMAWVRRGEN